MNAIEWARAQWDRLLAVVLFSAGGLAILAGWAGVRHEALTAAQIPYIISGGLGGISLIGVGAVFWLSADLRDEWRRLDDLAGDQRPPAPSAEQRTEDDGETVLPRHPEASRQRTEDGPVKRTENRPLQQQNGATKRGRTPAS